MSLKSSLRRVPPGRLTRLASALACCFALGTIASCSSGDLELLSLSCDADADCQASGGRCDLSSRICQTALSRQVAIEIIPPANNQGWVAQEYPRVDPGVDGRVRLNLRPVVSMQGRVRTSAEEEAIPARITVWRDSTIPGRTPLQSNALSVDEGEDYVLWLESGTEHRLSIQPQAPYDSQFPANLVRVAPAEHVKQDLLVDGHDRFVLIRGKVSDANRQPLPFSVQVRAFELNGWRRSTLAWTCSRRQPENCTEGRYREADDGAFSFRIPPGAVSYSLQIESIPAGAEALQAAVPAIIPTVSCKRRVLGLVDVNAERVQILPEALRLPSFEQARQVTLRVKGSEGEALAGVLVKLHADLPMDKTDLTDCEATHTVSTVTNADGVAAVAVLGHERGLLGYRLDINPPSRSPYGRATRQLRFAPSDNLRGLEITLQKRLRVEGVIRDWRGQPVSHASIQTIDVAEESGRTATEADEYGQVTFYVDFGLHRFLIVPPEGLGLPRTIIERRFDNSAIDTEWSIVPGRLLSGTVRLEDGRPAKGFGVGAYAVDAESSRVEGQALTDDQGQFQLILPGP